MRPYGYGGGSRGGPRLPSLPPGFAYLVDVDGRLLTDADGATLIVEI